MIIGDWAIHASNGRQRIPAPAPPQQSDRSSTPAYVTTEFFQRQFLAYTRGGFRQARCRPKKEIAANAANKTNILPRAAHGSTPRPPAGQVVEQQRHVRHQRGDLDTNRLFEGF